MLNHYHLGRFRSTRLSSRRPTQIPNSFWRLRYPCQRPTHVEIIWPWLRITTELSFPQGARRHWHHEEPTVAPPGLLYTGICAAQPNWEGRGQSARVPMVSNGATWAKLLRFTLSSDFFFFFYSERRGSVLRSLVFLSLEFDDLFPFNLQSLFLLQWLFALARHDINYWRFFSIFPFEDTCVFVHMTLIRIWAANGESGEGSAYPLLRFVNY